MIDDEVLARLQRVAYGADSPPEERERALAELARIAPHVLPPPPDHDRDAAEGWADDAIATATPRPDGSGWDETEPFDAEPPDGSSDDERADQVGDRRSEASESHRIRRRVGAAAGAALAVGVVIGAIGGWTAAQRARDDAEAVRAAAASTSPGVPIEETDLLPMFDRLPPLEDTSRIEEIAPGVDPTSARLVATRADGPSAYVARTRGGQDVCLILLLPSGPSPTRCTAQGLFPTGGIEIRYRAEGYGFAIASLNAFGSVELGLVVDF